MNTFIPYILYSLGLVIGMLLTAVLLGVVGSAVNTIIGKFKMEADFQHKI
jgi:hypothetical protein